MNAACARGGVGNVETTLVVTEVARSVRPHVVERVIAERGGAGGGGVKGARVDALNHQMLSAGWQAAFLGEVSCALPDPEEYPACPHSIGGISRPV